MKTKVQQATCYTTVNTVTGEIYDTEIENTIFEPTEKERRIKARKKVIHYSKRKGVNERNITCEIKIINK